MADEILPPPLPPNTDVGLPVDDPRLNHDLYVEVTSALTTQSIVDWQNSDPLDHLNPAWINQHKMNMRNARYQAIADYQARKTNV